MNSNSISRYLLGDEEDFVVSRIKRNPFFSFLNEKRNIKFYTREGKEYRYSTLFINMLLKLEDNISSLYHQIFEIVIKQDKEYDFMKILSKYGTISEDLIFESIEKDFFNKISEYILPYNGNMIPYLGEYVINHENQGINFCSYNPKYGKDGTLYYPDYFTDEDRRIFNYNCSYFEIFNNIFKGELLSNEQFNNFLYYLGSNNEIIYLDYFIYMILEKGKYIIDFNLLATIQDENIKEILYFYQKYWTNKPLIDFVRNPAEVHGDF